MLSATESVLPVVVGTIGKKDPGSTQIPTEQVEPEVFTPWSSVIWAALHPIASRESDCRIMPNGALLAAESDAHAVSTNSSRTSMPAECVNTPDGGQLDDIFKPGYQGEDGTPVELHMRMEHNAPVLLKGIQEDFCIEQRHQTYPGKRGSRG